jgi:hypothetical protein
MKSELWDAFKATPYFAANNTFKIVPSRISRDAVAVKQGWAGRL